LLAGGHQIKNPPEVADRWGCVCIQLFIGEEGLSTGNHETEGRPGNDWGEDEREGEPEEEGGLVGEVGGGRATERFNIQYNVLGEK